MKNQRTLLFSFWAVLFLACVQPARAQSYSILNNTAEPLRARFNEAAGKVRLLLLVSPT